MGTSPGAGGIWRVALHWAGAHEAAGREWAAATPLAAPAPATGGALRIPLCPAALAAT